MNRSFYNGISGTKTFQYGMDTLANNISNVNTTGFKKKETEFSSIFSQTLSESATLPTSNQIGLGSRIGATTTQMTQGSLVRSDNLFDLAIGGDGWFQIQRGDQILYTRKGTFAVDALEFLTDGQGGYLKGVNGNIFTPNPTNPNGYIARLNNDVPLSSNTVTSKILLPTEAVLPANPSTEASLAANLNPTLRKDLVVKTIPSHDYQNNIDPTTQTIDITGTVTPSNEIFDPKPGETVEVTVTNRAGVSKSFTTTLDNNLNWQLNAQDIAILNPTTEGPLSVTATLTTYQEIPNIGHFQVPIIVSSGHKGLIDLHIQQILPPPLEGSRWSVDAKVLEYDSIYDPQQVYDTDQYYIDEESHKVYLKYDEKVGQLIFNAQGALISNTLPNLSNGVGTLHLSLGTPYEANVANSGFDGLTTLAQLPTTPKATSSNGYESGTLMGYNLEQSGTIYANFSNGKSSAVATIPVYHFQNDQGLSSEGGVYFSATPNSGKPFFYTDGSGRVVQGASIMAYTLESSNVSLTNALTEMILMQKAFDANAKSITTSDQMIQKAINMKK